MRATASTRGKEFAPAMLWPRSGSGGSKVPMASTPTTVTTTKAASAPARRVHSPPRGDGAATGGAAAASCSGVSFTPFISSGIACLLPCSPGFLDGSSGPCGGQATDALDEPLEEAHRVDLHRHVDVRLVTPDPAPVGHRLPRRQRPAQPPPHGHCPRAPE